MERTAMPAQEQEQPDLRLLRMRKGWSQLQLAEKAGLSNEAISHWEHGDNAPRMENAEKLADALGVTITELYQAIRKSQAQRKTSPDPPQGKYRRVAIAFAT